MTHKKYAAADHHFAHKRILTFTYQGKVMRPFGTIEDHDMHIVKQHNAVVNDVDTVYFLGDTVINKAGLKYLGLMNGRKILVKGNHDIFPLKEYLPYFEDVRAYKVFEGRAILSHIPVHPQEMKRFKKNIHGHDHSKQVRRGVLKRVDPRYICVSMEQIDFTPVDLDILL